MKKNIILFAIVTLFAIFTVILLAQNTTSQAGDSGDFRGVFSTDTYPVTKHKIIKAGDVITLSTWLRSPQKEDFNDNKNFLNSIAKTVEGMKLRISMKATQKNFNGVLGYRVTVTQMWNGFGSSIINGTEGIGYALVTATGTPVQIN